METQVISERIGLVTSPQPSAGLITEALEASASSQRRRWLFRGVRLMCASGLLWAAALLAQKQLTVVSSDQACLNGPITALRSPIAGVLQLEFVEPGMPVCAGATLFRVDNPRFGNVEAMAQLNWLEELVDRLRMETAEAELRYATQEELFKHQEALFKEKLIPRLEYLTEEAKVALCRITLHNRKDQLRAAQTRSREIERQLALQKQAVTTMPFDGVVWSVRAQTGSEVGGQETVLYILDPKRVWVDAFVHEKHAHKFQVGTPVIVRAMDSEETWPGRVESIRAGAGRVDFEQLVAVPAGDLTRRRVAVRIKLESPTPFTAREFFGMGRSVKVTLPGHE